ncbi:hypothetical protein [Mesorhizobium sp. DCY119]|uniref:hypothetical protein n=1 Tax=Mesorhizobium sp. DCY119 TaxID=2108445 RepID=UPI000E6C3338|nr:hypothetical protein [Mesorhizobium sp. DCY119]RJG45462.1 hypothetical protein D3Y55_15160 [Mesorhizobium sp. DCY119]
MHFVGIALVAIVLVAMFPRAAGFILLAVAGLIVFFVLNILEARRNRENVLERMSIGVIYSEAECSSAYPIQVTFSNKSTKTVTKYSIDLTAHIAGRSSVVFSQTIQDDKIINPGQVYSSCWRLSGLDQAGTVRGVPPRELQWSYRYGRVDW